MTPDEAHAILDEHFAPWVKALQPEMLETETTHVLARMPVGPHLIRVSGIVSGQALAALADTIMVLAAVAHAGEFRLYATTDLHTQFMKAATSDVLCRAEVVRSGRSLAFTRAVMTEESSGKTVATATATFFAT